MRHIIRYIKELFNDPEMMEQNSNQVILYKFNKRYVK